MKILVTGSNGQLGSEIKAIHRTHNTHEFTFVDVAEMDLSDQKSIDDYLSEKSFDLIINCGAYTNVDGAEDDVELANKINGEAPGIIAKYCAQNNCRLIHISTDYVFNGEFNRPIKEDDKPNPVSVYGKSKLVGEINVQKHLNDAYIIRTSWVYSTFGKNFVKTMMRLGTEKDEINVVNDQFGSPTYANDLASVIFKIIETIDTEMDQPGLYHYCNEGICSWYDFATQIMNDSNLACKVNPIPSSAFPTKAKRPEYSVLNQSKIKQQFNIEVVDWKQSLKSALKQMK